MHPCVYFHPFQEIRSKNQLPPSYPHLLLRSSLAAAVLQKYSILVDGLLHSPTDEIRSFPLAGLEDIALIPAKSGCRRKASATVTMSALEKAMIAIIEAFHQYSGKEGDKHKLKKSELKELINNELPHFLGEIKDQETVDKVMETLDADGDAECDFQEFVAFIAMVTSACHEFFEHE
ncbi:unnamed protein product [Lepidochelys olivacea]